MKKVAILGAGGTGLFMAADQMLGGNEVRLWEDRSNPKWKNIEDVRARGGIELTGNAATGFAKAPLLTQNLAEAVAGADAILISAVTQQHAAIAWQLAPLLKDGQAVCFSAGNSSSIVLRGLLPRRPDVVVGEMSGNVYPARLIGPAKLVSAFAYKPKAVAAFPGKDTARLIEAFAGVYAFVPEVNVLAALLNSPNIVGHLAGSLLNAGGIDRNPGFLLYTDGMSESIFRVAEAVEAEKLRVMERMGYAAVRHAPMLRKVGDYGDYPELDIFRTLAGPSSMTHRYVDEDASFGQRILLSLADTIGEGAPATRALLLLAGIVNRRDYLAEGMTLERLGITGRTPEAINAYLEEGGGA
ncbi:MAG: NAD/NADP octopine/nopaline dehydrogenase family protein [Clostridiales Family XIII bacterium]|jgi:opine dehydrogenase|nr:NAD/NADP octopine/nopaline dehydrogenase family protein [Clostridiales Family XIII bacterium]